MRKPWLVSVALVALTASALLAAPLATAAPKQRLDVRRSGLEGFSPAAVPGEVIVKFRRPTSRAVVKGAIRASGARLVAGPVAGFSIAKAASGASVASLRASLESNPAVAYTEPNYLRYLSGVATDPRFSDQWGSNNTGQAHSTSNSTASRVGVLDADMDVAEAWDTQEGNSDTIVAIMDSGVDVTHPDLIPSLWNNPGETAGNGVDDDGNGYVDDIYGWDFADDDATLIHSAGQYAGWDHGTHVAGIVGAAKNNGVGIAGVCPGCKLMVLKMFEPYDTDGDGAYDSMVGSVGGELAAFDYAMQMGADVINGSFGASVASSRSERAAIKDAIADGITVVLAAGNEDSDNDLLNPGLDFDGDGYADTMSPAYPASYDLPGIISVGASNDSDQHAFSSECFAILATEEWPCSFTNWGHESVDVSAPGVDILSTVPGGGYDTWDGTSMATPNVAGVAGLVISQNPGYTPEQVANAIMNSADQPLSLQLISPFPGSGPLSGEFTVTSGRVNAAAALGGSTVDNFPTTDSTVTGARSLSGTASDDVSWPADINDVYKKSLTKGVVYKAVLNTAGTHDLDMQIYKPGTKEIWQFDERCFGGSGCPVYYYNPTISGDDSYRFKAPKSGTFYFHVNAWFLEAGDYTFKVVKV